MAFNRSTRQQQRWATSRKPEGRARVNKGAPGCNVKLFVEDARFQVECMMPRKATPTVRATVYTRASISGFSPDTPPQEIGFVWEGTFRHTFQPPEIEGGREYLQGVLLWLAEEHVRAGTLEHEVPF